jgi:hypothetical protein
LRGGSRRGELGVFSALCLENSVSWSRGEGVQTDETLLRFHGLGEVRDGDAAAHGDVVEGFPCHEEVGGSEVGHLGRGA